MIKVRGMFGDIDASVEKEKENLRKCFINTQIFNQVTDSEIYILRGFKGSGKTALLQRLSMCGKICDECNLDLKFCDSGKFGIIYIDADEILTKFSGLAVSEHTQFDLELAWLNLLKIVSYERVIIDHGNSESKQQLKALHDLEEFRNTRSEKLADVALGILASALTQGGGDAQQFAGRFLRIIEDPEGKFNKVERSAIKLLQSDIGMKYCVVFDGFDHIPLENKTAAIKFVTELTYSMITFGYKYNFLRERINKVPNVCLKIFLPEDFAITAEIRDNIKYMNRSEVLKWKTTDLKKFITVRTYEILKKYKKGLKLDFAQKNMDHIWKMMFGDVIENQHYKIKGIRSQEDTFIQEDTFRYILRHTLYRARDLQIIGEQIIKHADEINGFENEQEFATFLPVHPESIRTGVNRGSRELVKRLFDEFALMDLAGMVNQFKTSSNIFDYEYLRDKVEGYSGINNQPIDKKIQLLYKVGLIGKFFRGDNLNRDNRIKEETRHYGECRKVIDSFPLEYYMSVFSFAGNFKETISKGDMLVIAPMFNDYLNMANTVDDRYLIEPVHR